MKTIAITIFMACALFGAGCSDDRVTTSPTMLTPQPDFPIDQAASPNPIEQKSEEPPPLVAAKTMPVLTETTSTSTPTPTP